MQMYVHTYVCVHTSVLILWLYKNWLPDFVGVTVVIFVLEMFGRKLNDPGKLVEVAVESIYIYTYIIHH